MRGVSHDRPRADRCFPYGGQLHRTVETRVFPARLAGSPREAHARPASHLHRASACRSGPCYSPDSPAYAPSDRPRARSVLRSRRRRGGLATTARSPAQPQRDPQDGHAHPGAGPDDTHLPWSTPSGMLPFHPARQCVHPSIHPAMPDCKIAPPLSPYQVVVPDAPEYSFHE